jgi:glycosyltransferase involved in cell wall biosynthesis
MDILIKSFNRPYYLDRCLTSIYQYVQGDFVIKILDDGTAQKYLDKVKDKFPEVEILYSDNYAVKSAAVERHLDGESKYNNFTIPSEFWYRTVADSSDVFILIEDDIWFTGDVNVESIEKDINENNMVMLRLSWQGNGSLVAGDKVTIGNKIEKIIPKIPFFDELIFTNKFKLRSVLYRLGFLNSIMKYQIKFYVLYAVAAAAFRKDYWLYLWKDALQVVHEETQLKKAAYWYNTHKSAYGKLLNEAAETSYISSTYNAFREIDFDMIKFNHIINELWFNEDFDSMENFPKDFSMGYIRDLLNKTIEGKHMVPAWIKWVDRFKDSYRKVGCRVE